MNRSARRVNTPLLLGLLLGAGLITVGIVVIHRMQVARNAGALSRLAQAKLESGNRTEAIGLYARYLAYRPNDAAAQAAFARLVVEFAERPEATKDDRSSAYGVLDTAVRKNPDDLELRRQLIDWMLRFRRFGDAAKELTILRERLAEKASDDDLPESLDIGAIDVLRAQSLIGIGEFREAAEAVAAVIGFDMERKAFVEGALPTPPPDVARDASLILASLLESKLNAAAAATPVLESLVTANPGDVRAWLALAQWHQTHGGLDRAAAAMREAAALAPDDPSVLFCDFELSLAEKRLDVAEQLADKARSLYADDERSYRAQASVAMRRQQPDQAIARLNEGLAMAPRQSGLLRMLADVLLQSNRIDDAAEAIATLVQIQGDKRPAVSLLQARLLMAQKRWLAAKKKLDAIRPMVADSEQMTMQVDLCLGQCHEMLGQFDEQLAANRRVLLEDHKSVAARVGVANALAASGRPDAALAELEAVAGSLPAAQLPKLPAVWSPLLQLRIAQQMRRPPSSRDWSQIERLLETLEKSAVAPASQLVLLRADILARRGEAKAATDLLRRAVEADPASVPARAALAVQTLREQGPAAAHDVLAGASPEAADDPLFLTIEAQLAARLPPDESAAALARLEEKALSLQRDQAVRILSAVASIHRGLGQADEAERSWKAALKIAPDEMGAHTSLFDLAIERRDLDKAQASAASISRLAGPTSPEGLVAAATVLILEVQLGVQRAQAARISDQGAAADGDTDADEVPELAPQDVERLATARNLLIEAENVRPGWPQTQQAFADVALLQGDRPTAIERLQAAMRMGPANPVVVRRLVSLLYGSNRLEEARQTLALVETDGLNGLERFSAELDMRAGQWDRAIALAERSVTGAPRKSPSDLLWFGQLLARAGRHDRARDVLRQAVEADPTQAAGWMALFLSQVAAGARPAAEQTLEQGKAALPAPRRQLLLAQGNETLGRIDEAERLFREAVAVAPDRAVTARSLAGFLIRQGRLTAAREELNALIATAGDAPATRRSRVWARRTLADLMVRGGSFRSMQEALQLLEDNAAEEGRPSADDLAIQVGILAARPEPDSWRRALVLLDSLGERQPLSTDQRLQKASLLDLVGRWEEGRAELLSVASAPNTPPTVHTLLIEKLISHEELDDARIWLKTLADRFPDAPLVAALQARLALAENDRPAALAAARRLVPEGSPTAETAGQLESFSALLESLGFTSAADELFTKYAAVSTQGIVARAGFLGRTQRTDEALDLLEASWDRLPLEPLLRSAVAAMTASGTAATPDHTARVAAWFERARRQDPDSPNLELLFADFMGATGGPADAVATYRALLARQDITPQQRAIAANNLAFHLADPTTASEAEQLVATALAELGPHPDLLDTRGVVLMAAGKNREALADLRESILVPSATKYLHLAAALAGEQDASAAREALAEGKKMGLTTTALTPGDRIRLEALEATLGP